MVKDLKLRQAGGSVSATLPKDMADRLHLAPGDRVLAVETENGILLPPYDPRVEQGLETGLSGALSAFGWFSSGDFRRPREPARTYRSP